MVRFKIKLYFKLLDSSGSVLVLDFFTRKAKATSDTPVSFPVIILYIFVSNSIIFVILVVGLLFHYHISNYGMTNSSSNTNVDMSNLI